MTVQYSIQKMVSDGTLSTIALGIQYLQRNDIYIRIAGVETPQSGAPSGYTWSFVNNTTLKILPVIPNGTEVVVYRRTDVDAMYNIYSQNAQFDEATIDENNQQLLYIAQEYLEQGIPGAGVDTIEFLRDDGINTYYRIKRTDGSYSEEFTVPSASNSTKVLTRESLRRSYAAASYNLVDGSFETGGTLVNANDVLLHEASGKAFSGPAGVVAAGTNPASGGFVDRSNQLSPFVTIKNYGAKVDGVSDDTQAVRDMVEDLGYFTLPAGNTVISDSIAIPDSPVALGSKWSGAGIERSKIICVGMTGKSALVTKNPNAYYRLTMSDFSISGDCDSCIDMNITDGSNFQLYQSEFRNLALFSTAGSTFKANRHFSTAWYNVHTSSNNGHGFDIQGGNSTVLVNCYAHRSGSGKAGYRIRGKAVLVGCNGVDSGDVWGDFGATVAADGANYTYNITIIGGNIEDFNNNAITLRFTGRLSFDGTAFVAKASGTYETLIKGNVYGASDSSITDINTTFVTKGAVMTAQSNIIHSAGIKLVESTRGVFTNVFNTSTGLLIATPVKEAAMVAVDKMAIKYGSITWDRGYGFMLQQSNGIASGTTSPSVLRKNLITTANTSPTTIQYLVDGELGQRVTLLIRDSNTILQNQAPGVNRLKLKTGANINAVNGDVYEFVFNNNIWVQL